jgi:hypothetical protein
MTTDELMKKILETAPSAFFRDENGFIQVDTMLTECNNCDQLIATDVHEEELGMCVNCSNEYFDHTDEEEMENN